MEFEIQYLGKTLHVYAEWNVYRGDPDPHSLSFWADPDYETERKDVLYTDKNAPDALLSLVWSEACRKHCEAQEDAPRGYAGLDTGVL